MMVVIDNTIRLYYYIMRGILLSLLNIMARRTLRFSVSKEKVFIIDSGNLFNLRCILIVI